MNTSMLIGLAAVIALFFAFVAMRPSEFRVTRSTIILAPPEPVFAQVNNLHNWEAWSPWAKLDPNATTTYNGAAAGVGAAFQWAGNNKIGQGRMTITESRPNELIRFNLEFLKPFKGNNTAEFTFKTSAGESVVTWSMSGKRGFMGKLFGLFLNCDNMVGCQFEKGLAQMKALAEEQAGKTAAVTKSAA